MGKKDRTNGARGSKTQDSFADAGNKVRKELLDLVQSSRATSLKRLVLRLGQALDAKLTKAQLNSQTGEWEYSLPLVDNTTRLKALELAFKLIDGFPSQKHELGGADGRPVSFVMVLPGKEKPKDG